MKPLIPLLFLLWLLACTSGPELPPRPNYVIPEDSLSMILAEVHLVSATYQHRVVRRNRLQDFARRDQQELLDSLGVSQERIDSSLTYYKHEPRLLEQIYDDALNILSTQLAEAKTKSPMQRVDSLKATEGQGEKSIKEMMEEDGRVLFGKRVPLELDEEDDSVKVDSARVKKEP